MPILKVTMEHLIKAREEEKEKKISNRSQTCIIAQAAKDLYGTRFYSCAGNHINLDYFNSVVTSDKIGSIIDLYDSNQYSILESMLPLEIYLSDEIIRGF